MIQRTADAFRKLLTLGNRPEHRLKPVPRKNRLQRFVELFYIAIRYGELSESYFIQGLDRIGTKISSDYFEYGRFKRIRDYWNASDARSRVSYGCLLQDKLLFARYFKANRFPIVESLCELRPAHEVPSGDEDSTSIADFITKNKDAGPFFCKPRFGIRGERAFRLECVRGKVSIDDCEMNQSMLEDALSEPYLCQVVLTQHPTLAALHRESVNTLRILTYRDHGIPKLFFVFLRMGADGWITDGNHAARAVVEVHPETGRLAEVGYWISGTLMAETRTHWNSHVRFAEVHVPYIHESVQLACDAHRWLPGLHTVGWDVAVTPEGPQLVEGNDDWAGGRPMMLMKNFQRKFLEIHTRAR